MTYGCYSDADNMDATSLSTAINQKQKGKLNTTRCNIYTVQKELKEREREREMERVRGRREGGG